VFDNCGWISEFGGFTVYTPTIIEHSNNFYPCCYMALRSPEGVLDYYYDVGGLYLMPVVKSAHEKAREGRVRTRWPRPPKWNQFYQLQAARWDSPFFVRR
jgi:hypothetical protein